MAKLAPTSIKYIIKAHIKANGVVEKPDVIGALFGQTEGLLGPDLDLRELQRTGRIGRIEVNIKSEGGDSEGEVIIPSSLDSAETSLIAATLETIDRVGPCTAEIKLIGVEDTRQVKRQFVVEKAKDILKNLMESGGQDSSEISEHIKESIRVDEITSHNGCPAGPGLMDSDEIIVVEGRADVVNLLKHGIRNTIAIEGTSVPQAVADLTREKIVTAFVDGDRGGKLIMKELMQKGEVDFVAVAPIGKEVEELAKKEIFKALRDKVTIEKYKAEELGRPPRQRRGYRSGDYRPTDRPPAAGRRFEPQFRTAERVFESTAGIPREGRYEFAAAERQQEGRGRREGRFDRRREPRFDREDRPPRAPMSPEQMEIFRSSLEELVGSRAACIFNEQGELLGRVPVTELVNTIRTVEKPFAVVFDGRVDAELEAVARKSGVKFLVGMEKDALRSSIGILSREDLEK
ncbi:MAG: DNA primase [Candidatus Aenigmarchaeota archaeon]|nr:DNA primase [Candidatus Aenigmarchaeota archaeon]